MSNAFTRPAVADTADESAAIRRGAKAIVSSSSRVLLVRERHSDGETFWTLPGGGVRSQESLVDGLRRELVEELRCDPVVEAPVSSFWYVHRGPPRTCSHYTAFSCSVVAGVCPVRSEGILEVAWVDPAEPPASTLPQVRHLLRDAAAVPWSGPR
jgi:ADP-ribose pyrophosphatase YjhB (NUDIX family)